MQARPHLAAAPTVPSGVLGADLTIAVILPCYDEGVSIRQVVQSFRAALPSADIYVYDNNSKDNTAEEASAAGAIVRAEHWPGKGNVVRRMFADIDADFYVMADGDGTYDASAAPSMVELALRDHLDMVVGTRMNIYEDAHRRGHGLGNRMFNSMYRRLFGRLFSDIFSGYRVFSHRFVKSFPAVSSGFEIETEMSVHASQLRIPIAEYPTVYGARQAASVSKLRTVHDALRILRTFIVLFKECRPAAFFGSISGVLLLLALVLGMPLFVTYFETGLVPRFPTAVLSASMVLLAAVFGVSGLILDSVARGRLEQKRIWYINSARRRY